MKKTALGIVLAALAALALPISPTGQASPLDKAAATAGKAVIRQITKSPKALPEEEIVRLADLAATPRGTKAVGRALGDLNLPREVLEDSYLRIAVKQGRLERQEAEKLYRNLSGTDGFGATVRKIVGNSAAKANGHLNELRLANAAVDRGFRVKGIGVRFDDGRKNAPTDIDVVLERRNKLVAIEAKDYSPDTYIPMDQFRADMDSLVEFRSRKAPLQVIPVFSITARPKDAASLRRLQIETEKRDIQFVMGSPTDQVEQIWQLCEIL